MDFGPGIRKVFTRYSDAYMRVFEKESGYTESQCGPCPHSHICCRMQVHVTPFEVAAINNFLNARLPRPVLKKVMKTIRLHAKVVQTHRAKYATETEAAEAWVDRNEMCGFYDKGKRICSIYPVRPLACRKVWSVGDCGKMEWNTMLDRMEVLRRRIEILPHYERYEQNVRELFTMLADMMGEKYTRLGAEFQRLLSDKESMDDLDIINPIEKNADTGVDTPAGV